MKWLAGILSILIIAFGINYFVQDQRESLQIGDPIPRIALPNQNGELITVNNYVGSYNLVVYFYPKDDTPGCTKQACEFRDYYERFLDLDAKVIGISSDDLESHKKFSAKYNLPYDLLSDEENQIRNKFGVPKSYGNLVPGRTTYIIDKKGVIQYVFNSAGDVEKHVTNSLTILNKLK